MSVAASSTDDYLQAAEEHSTEDRHFDKGMVVADVDSTVVVVAAAEGCRVAAVEDNRLWTKEWIVLVRDQ
jgi:hypothetical protein